MPESISAKLAHLVLPEAGGEEIRLGSLWVGTPDVLVFLRHYGWIFCRQLVAQLRELEQEFTLAGGTLAAIGLGDMHYAHLFREETEIGFPLLVDANQTAYKAAALRTANLLQVLRRDNAQARARARAAGHRQQRFGQNPFQLGASFIFGPGNRDLFVHLNRSFSDDASPSTLLSAQPYSWFAGMTKKATLEPRNVV